LLPGLTPLGSYRGFAFFVPYRPDAGIFPARPPYEFGLCRVAKGLPANSRLIADNP
jgi:hypothetical protein